MSPMTGVSSGRLDRTIVIQTPLVTTDPATGQEIDDWDLGESFTVAAEWLPATATETWKARQVDATIEGLYVTHDLDPRPTPEAARILGHDGRTYDVKGITEIMRGRGLLIAVAARAVAL